MSRLDRIIADDPSKLLGMLYKLLKREASVTEEKGGTQGESLVPTLLVYFAVVPFEDKIEAMIEFLHELSQPFRKQALLGIYCLWCVSEKGKEKMVHERGKKQMDKRLWLVWLRFTEEEECFAPEVQHMRELVERGEIVLTEPK